MITKRSELSIAAVVLLLMCLCRPTSAADNPGNEPVCDVTADRFLAVENYPEAIRLHREFLHKHPASALAHYHLGFAEGMVGDKTRELSEYRSAAALGLSRWDLFLNTGLALMQDGQLGAATDALQHAVRLAPNQSEAHFNLGLVYERRDMLIEAEHEMLAALHLEPEELDARNMLGVIYAREGKPALALVQWHDLLRDAPTYGPARANLAILGNKQPVSATDKEARIHSRPFLNSHEGGP